MIEFRSVTKRFPDGTVAVDDFSLVVPSRQITVLVGSSGSGKTTILRMINRMVDPTSGTVEIDGEGVDRLKPVQLRRSIGYVMQNSGLLPHRKVVDNIATVPLLRGEKRSSARPGAGTDGDRRAGAFARRPVPRSALRRTAAARGRRSRARRRPEHSADGRALRGAVDPIVREDLQNELLRLQRELGKTVVFVTHDIDEAFRLGDQVVIFRKGGIVAQKGAPAEILAAPADEFVTSFVGADRGKRVLHIEQTPAGSVLVDSEGRAAGVLSGLEPGAASAAKAAAVPIAGAAQGEDPT